MKNISDEFCKILLSGLKYQPKDRVTLQNLLNMLNNKPTNPRLIIKASTIEVVDKKFFENQKNKDRL